MTQARSTSTKAPLAFMMLWKPSDYDWESLELPQQLESLRQGLPAEGSWSVNNFPKLIRPGHRVFMRRVADPLIGVVGEGVVASDVYWAPSYKDEDLRDMPYVDIDWVALTPFDPLPPHGVSTPVNAVTHRWASAIYEESELDALHAAWSTHLRTGAIDRGGSISPRTRTALREERTFQGQFRRAVLDAHGERCSLCGLDESAVLDAAHLVPHSSGGLPTAENGRPLCANHHRAFDRQLLFWDGESQAFGWVDDTRKF